MSSNKGPYEPTPTSLSFEVIKEVATVCVLNLSKVWDGSSWEDTITSGFRDEMGLFGDPSTRASSLMTKWLIVLTRLDCLLLHLYGRTIPELENPTVI